MNYLLEWLKWIAYRAKWHLAILFNFSSPVHVDIELTNRCNQKCLNCWHSEDKLPFKKKDMPIQKVCQYLDEGAAMGIKSVKFNLRGEALLHKNIVQAIKYAKQLGYITMLNTNAVLLDDKIINELNLNLDEMIISINSFWHHEYCHLHGANKKDFSLLRYNLNYLKKMYETGELKIKVKLNYHVNIINKNSTLEPYEENYKMFPLIRRYTMKRRGDNISLITKIRERKRHCPHMKRRLTVIEPGYIFPCCVCFAEPLDIMIGRETLKSAWNSVKRKTLLQNYKRGIYTDTCANCTSADVYRKHDI